MEACGLYDIYGMWYVPFWQRPAFMWSCFGLGLLFFIFLVCFLYSFIKKRKIKPLSCWQIIYNMIDSASVKYKEGVLTEPEVYVVLTAAMKEFLSAQYGLPLKGKTDDELICLLQEFALADEKKEAMERLFQNGVLIKFSPMHVTREQVEADLCACSLFVQESILDGTKQ